jgi:uncharacterized surface protein with fasciclin (FAS1) repeats
MNSLRAMAMRSVLALGMAGALAGCESGARQDPLLVRPSSDDVVFSDVPIFHDRTVDEAVVGELELADYAVALDRAGLLATLRQAGPFTVFAVPNEPLEAEQHAALGQLLAPENHAGLRRLIAYTIVPGRYTEPKLRRMIARQHGPVALTTLNGRDVLGVSLEAATGQLLLSDRQGHANRLWLANVPQSNGVLYVTQSLLSPADNVIATAAPASGMTYVPGDYNTGVGAPK